MTTEISTEVVQTESEKRFSQTLALVREAMLNPDVDADKAKVMAELMTGLEDRAQLAEYNRDFNAAVMDMPVISRDGRIIVKDKNTGAITQSTPFARFEDIDRIVRPIARSHNISYTFELGGDDKRITVRPVIRHRNGYVEKGDAFPLALDASGSKNNVQGAGSSATYGKRYALCAAFNIVTEGLDNDGHGNAQVSLPHEREQAVLAEAEAAAAEGRYVEHYNAQSPRDRAWLVLNKHHERLGGQALPPPSGGPAMGGGAPAGNQASGKESPQEVPQAARDFVRDYVAKINGMNSLDELTVYQEEDKALVKRTREKIKKFPDLWRDLIAAEERLDERDGA